MTANPWVECEASRVVKALRWLAALAVGTLLVVGRATWFLLKPPHQTDDVPSPPADASPEQVVRAYLEALNAHDCATAEEVMAEGSESVADDWCRDLAHLTHIRVGQNSVENPQWLGFPRGTDEEFVSVPVSFDLDWRLLHSDGTMSQGPTSWGYVLFRDGPDHPWLIFDQGCC
jgi:hypothetical protein